MWDIASDILWSTCLSTTGRVIVWKGIPSREDQDLYEVRTEIDTRAVHGGSIDDRGVDTERVYLPVSIYECLGVLIDDWWGISISVRSTVQQKSNSQSLQDMGEQPLADQTDGEPAQSP